MGANFMSILPFLILFLGTGISLCTKNCDQYQSNCGVVLDIKSPFRFEGDPEECGLPDYQLTCEHNWTELQLGSNEYFVEAIHYKANIIRVTDPRVDKGKVYLAIIWYYCCSEHTLSLLITSYDFLLFMSAGGFA